MAAHVKAGNAASLGSSANHRPSRHSDRAWTRHDTGRSASRQAHGQTIPPDGIPNDYINVDTYVHKRVAQ
jgi:hypothetical protein